MDVITYVTESVIGLALIDYISNGFQGLGRID